MDISDLTELHYIAPISNLPSVMKHGILSHERASRLDHESVANATVQARRKDKRIPAGRHLHEYANLYIHARNPMLFRLLRSTDQELCVVCVRTDILYLEGVIITDGNASSDYTGFWPSPEGLSNVDAELSFAEWWAIGVEFERYERIRRKCAEVLVPDRVGPEHIAGVYVSCEAAKQAVEAEGIDIAITLDAHLFFL